MVWIMKRKSVSKQIRCFLRFAIAQNSFAKYCFCCYSWAFAGDIKFETDYRHLGSPSKNLLFKTQKHNETFCSKMSLNFKELPARPLFLMIKNEFTYRLLQCLWLLCYLWGRRERIYKNPTNGKLRLWGIDFTKTSVCKLVEDYLRITLDQSLNSKIIYKKCKCTDECCLQLSIRRNSWGDEDILYWHEIDYCLLLIFFGVTLSAIIFNNINLIW